MTIHHRNAPERLSRKWSERGDGARAASAFARACLFVVEGGEFFDLEVASAGGRADGDLVALLTPHEAAADGRGRRDEPLRRVALLGRDEAVGDLLLALGVVEDERRAIGRLALRHLRDV